MLRRQCVGNAWVVVKSTWISIAIFSNFRIFWKFNRIWIAFEFRNIIINIFQTDSDRDFSFPGWFISYATAIYCYNFECILVNVFTVQFCSLNSGLKSLTNGKLQTLFRKINKCWHKVGCQHFRLRLGFCQLKIEQVKSLEIRFLPSLTLITPSLSPIEQHSDSVNNLYPISP